MTNLEIRPRRLGELFDDASRIYLANFPLLLVLIGILYVPCVILLLAVLTQAWSVPVVVILLAGLLPFGGLANGACQEVFHCWAERQPASIRRSLSAALRRWLNHVTAQALLIVMPVTGVLFLFMPYLWPLGLVALAMSVPISVMGLIWHAVLTGGQKHVWKAWQYSRRAAGRHLSQAMVIVLGRAALLLVGMINLQLFITFGIWMLDQLAGFDLGYLLLVLTVGNPCYLLLLAALVWWLLAPFNEAVNYLFYADTRARYEGLDLWYRIDEHFAVRKAAPAAALSLGAIIVLISAAPAHAQNRLAVIKQARQDVSAVAKEMTTANPYPGGEKWRSPLRGIARRLDPVGDAHIGRYQWFYQGINKLGQEDRDADLKIVADMQSRLKSIEQSLSRFKPRDSSGQVVTAKKIRALVPPLTDKARQREGDDQAQKKKAEKKADDDPVRKDRDLGGAGVPARRSNVGVVAPIQIGGAVGQLLLMFLIVLAVVIILAGVAYAVRSFLQNRRRFQPIAQGQNQPAEEFLENPDAENVQNLWRRADDLARAGQFLEALRTLYLAVLAMLHQAHLIRYERTRTNGEYANQLRSRAALHQLFLGLTSRFEVKWYGERACAAEDYQASREMVARLEEQTKQTATKSE